MVKEMGIAGPPVILTVTTPAKAFSRPLLTTGAGFSGCFMVPNGPPILVATSPVLAECHAKHSMSGAGRGSEWQGVGLHGLAASRSWFHWGMRRERISHADRTCFWWARRREGKQAIM